MTDVKNSKAKSPKMPDLSALGLKSPIKAEDVELHTTDKATLKKINALKNVQFQMLDVESKFYDELHELECRYAKLYEPFYEKRKKIITGEYEPTNEEGKWALDELDEDAGEKPAETNGDAKKEEPEEKGIKNFWLETLQSFRITSEIIQEYDEPILSYLEDVKVRLFESKPYGYVLEFYFAENPYFTNKVLTKTYELKTEVDPKDPFSFDGPDLEKAVGCKVDWKPNKNVTVKLIKKKLKSRNKKTPPKIVTKEEKQDSFFNFFDTPGKHGKSAKSPVTSSAEDGKTNNKQVALRSKHDSHSHDESHDDEHDEEDDEELYLIADFEIGQYLKEKIIPKAILYYTGEGVDDEFDDYDEDEEDEDDEDDEDHDDENEEDDDDEEDDDEEEDHGKKGKGKKQLAIQGKGKNGKAGLNPKGGEPTPSECKQN